MSLKEERLLLFQMLEHRKINVQDAQQLLEALEIAPPVEVFVAEEGACHLSQREVESLIAQALQQS